MCNCRKLTPQERQAERERRAAARLERQRAVAEKRQQPQKG